MAQDTIDTGGVIRIAAVSGTLLIVGIIAVYFVFGAWGWLDREHSGDLWSGMESLARVLLPLVLGGFFYLRRRWFRRQFDRLVGKPSDDERAEKETDPAAEEKIALAAKLAENRIRATRRVVMGIGFIVGLVMGFGLAVFAAGAYYDASVAANAADTFFLSTLPAHVGEARAHFWGPITAGLCLTILVFGAKSFGNLLQPPEHELEEPVLSFYFGVVLGVLLFLVFS